MTKTMASVVNALQNCVFIQEVLAIFRFIETEYLVIYFETIGHIELQLILVRYFILSMF